MNWLIPACAALAALSACASSPVPPEAWIDFATLEPGSPGNRYLLCSPDICHAAGDPDEVLRFSHAADEVAAVIAQFEPSAVQRQLPNGDYQLKYVAVTPVARFRDDVDVLVHAETEYSAEVAIYSRSRVGLSDLGKNRSRVDALIGRLRDELGR